MWKGVLCSLRVGYFQAWKNNKTGRKFNLKFIMTEFEIDFTRNEFINLAMALRHRLLTKPSEFLRDLQHRCTEVVNDGDWLTCSSARLTWNICDIILVERQQRKEAIKNESQRTD